MVIYRERTRNWKKSMAEYQNAAEAIELVGSCISTGRRLLGVDGIQISNGSHIGRLDLILDLSTEPITPQDAEAKAIQFVSENAGSDIVFDVAIGD